RIVVDKDDLPGNAGQRRFQPPVQHRDVVALVEGGNDDRKLGRNDGQRRLSRPRRGVGTRSDGFIHAARVYPQAPAMPRRAKTLRTQNGKQREPGRAKTPPKMPTTTNRGRAYIRRCRAIQWSSQRRSYQASTSPLNAK